MFCYILEEAAVNEVCYSRLSLHFHSFTDLSLHGSGSSVENYWQYQKHYHKLLGQKSVAFCYKHAEWYKVAC